MNILKLRDARASEYMMCEVPEGTPNAIECLQGEHCGKWFLHYEDLLNAVGVTPNDGENYLLTIVPKYCFQAIEEIEPQPFDLRAWELSVVEPAIRQHIEGIIRVMPYDYFSINEVSTWISDAEFGEQAAAVAEWIKECWKYVRAAIDGADINDLPAIEDIINGLPELNII